MMKVDFLVFPFVEELDVTGPFEIVGKLADVIPNQYELRVLASTKVTVCSHGLRIVRTHALDPEKCGSIVVVPGGKGVREVSKERSKVIEYLRSTYKKYEFILSVCTGTFLLSEAGILTNRVCTTHTRYREELAHTHTVVPHRVVHHGKVITSAGVTAGIDASLYVVILLCGKSTAEKVIERIEYPFSVDTILEMVHTVSVDE